MRPRSKIFLSVHFPKSRIDGFLVMNGMNEKQCYVIIHPRFHFDGD